MSIIKKSNVNYFILTLSLIILTVIPLYFSAVNTLKYINLFKQSNITPSFYLAELLVVGLLISGIVFTALTLWKFIRGSYLHIPLFVVLGIIVTYVYPIVCMLSYNLGGDRADTIYVNNLFNLSFYIFFKDFIDIYNGGVIFLNAFGIIVYLIAAAAIVFAIYTLRKKQSDYSKYSVSDSPKPVENKADMFKSKSLYCTKCGEPLDSDTIFCPKCGKSIISKTTETKKYEAECDIPGEKKIVIPDFVSDENDDKLKSTASGVLKINMKSSKDKSSPDEKKKAMTDEYMFRNASEDDLLKK